MRLLPTLSTIAFSALALLPAPLASQDRSSVVEAELTAYNDEYNRIIRDYDLEAFVALYADKPLWIAPDKAPVEGHDVPRGTFGFIIENQGSLTHTFDRFLLSDDGSQAVMIGTYALNVETQGAKADGTYLFVLNRVGDQWKIAVDMFNQHAPE